MVTKPELQGSRTPIRYRPYQGIYSSAVSVLQTERYNTRFRYPSATERNSDTPLSVCKYIIAYSGLQITEKKLRKSGNLKKFPETFKNFSEKRKAETNRR